MSNSWHGGDSRQQQGQTQATLHLVGQRFRLFPQSISHVLSTHPICREISWSCCRRLLRAFRQLQSVNSVKR